jgi:hypothetical protein
MSEGFVPLAAKPSGDHSAEPFRLKVLANANGPAVPFQPIGALRGASPAPSAHGEHAGQPQVSLVREGDRITGVRVQCGCGEVIELQCVY